MVSRNKSPMVSGDESRPRPRSRRVTIEMSFSLGNEEEYDEELQALLAKLYGTAERVHNKDQDVIVTVEDILGIKDSLTLVKCSPLGSHLSVNCEDVEGSDEEDGIQTTFCEEIVVTKTDTNNSRRRATRRMSLNSATKKVSICMSIRSNDVINAELQDILLQLYDNDEEEENQDGTDGSSVGDVRSGIHRANRRSSLVKCKKITADK